MSIANIKRKRKNISIESPITMLRVKFLIALLSIFTLASCDRNGVYEENINTSNNSWNENDIAKFVVPIKDTVSYHNVYINIRNTTDYSNSNLYLFITVIAPTGATQLDTVECYLADEQGNWLGKGFGYIRDNRIQYKRNIRFPHVGDYKFEIKQAMRTDDLKGISSIGVRIEKSTPK
jgi:gliding motility-associated lipoprotein GldH